MALGRRPAVSLQALARPHEEREGQGLGTASGERPRRAGRVQVRAT